MFHIYLYPLSHQPLSFPSSRRQPPHFFPLRLSELLLSQSNVCVYLINSEALLITATGRHVAWMVTHAASELTWDLDRDATWPGAILQTNYCCFFTNLLTSPIPVWVIDANSKLHLHTAYVELWTMLRGVTSHRIVFSFHPCLSGSLFSFLICGKSWNNKNKWDSYWVLLVYHHNFRKPAPSHPSFRWSDASSVLLTCIK